MTGRRTYGRLQAALRALRQDQDGAALVEFAIVVSLFFFMFFAIVDIGRLAYSFVMAEKAAQLAIHTTVVRPPACAGLSADLRYTRGTATPPPRFGTSCSAASGACATYATVTCQGNASNATAAEVWARIQPLLPNNAAITDLQFSYSFDPNLGFLGGPYVPMVTVNLGLPDFQFVSPLGALAVAAGAATPGNLGTNLSYPTISASLPAEDLNLGNAG